MTAIHWPDFLTFTYFFPCDALSEEILWSYRVHIWYGKTRMDGLQSRKGRMMISSVVWAQYINVTGTHIANAAPTHSGDKI